MTLQERIAVIGLGYVGLPLAVALARKWPGTIGFDINADKVRELRAGKDITGELEPGVLQASPLHITSDYAALEAATFFIVSVPTPVDENRQPDLSALLGACETVGKVMRPGAVVVFESTVWPGVTEDVCGPALEAVSGLTRGQGFKLGYSPERINPGDREHQLGSIVKVVAGEDAETMDRVAHIYASIVPAGLHRAPSIKVAEAAKVIENTQRDLNIALMNELAMIFDRFGIATRDVLEAACTKWNFLPFTPGLVGGHCIGVDPYYLTARAKQAGYYPQLILTGRRINDSVSGFIVNRIIRMLIDTGRPVKNARVGVLGVTFKENVRDLRNSRVPEIVHELRQFGVLVYLHDPHADAGELHHDYGLALDDLAQFSELDALLLAVPHQEFLQQMPRHFSMLREDGIMLDVKSALNRESIPASLNYWSL